MGFGTRVGIVGRVGTRVTTRLDLPVVGREPESGYAKITRGPPVLVIDILVSLDLMSS